MHPNRHSPLLVLSNRLPFTLWRGTRGLERRASTGGVISSLDPILRRRGGTWIGWPGLTLSRDESIPDDPAASYRIASVNLSEAEIECYYDGFSNRLLWPLFHSMPNRARFEGRDWRSYECVNRRFAETALDNTDPETPIWVNDYHLMLAPAFIRQQAPDQRVTFFLHIPFPPEDVFRRCPWHRELLQGLLGCDVVGFQIGRDVENFLRSAEYLPGAQVDRSAMLVRYAGRVTKVDAFPIGADFCRFDTWARSWPRQPGGARVILGIDRLDYTKGISERIHAFVRLLEQHPEHREKVVFVQLAVPSRPHLPEYQRLQRDVEGLVESVNRRFGTSTWSPIHYRHELLPQEQLARLYRDADIAFVTPLIDGMNLVAKEYVACQFELRGVLVLSRSAGASEAMREALIVDAFDIGGSAETLHRALVMDEHERRARMEALRNRERQDDADAWASRLLETFLTSDGIVSNKTDADVEARPGLGSPASRAQFDETHT